MIRRRTTAAEPLPEIKRCAIYTRKSTSIGLDQEFNSLDAQREACERYIERQAHLGWHAVSEQYDDGGFTGANLERPAFMRLMDDVNSKKVDVILVYKVDRLSRSLLDFAQVMDRFNRAGVAFVSVTQNFSTADAMGRLTLNMLMSFAEFEREMIAERTRDKIAASRRKGKWTGGQVPLGYDVVDKHLQVNDLEAVLVREIFDLYLQHRSALSVMHILNENRRTTKRHLTKSGNVHKARAWKKESVLRVLRNPVYIGRMPYRDELHPGEHEAVVDLQVFERVQRILDANHTPKTHRSHTAPYLLRGILKCGQCGKAYTSGSTSKKNGKAYRYYRCVTRDQQGANACLSKPLPADAIEDFVIDRIREAAAEGSVIKDITEELRGMFAKRRDDLQTERRDLPCEIAKLSAEGHKLVETRANADRTAHRLLSEHIEDVGEQINRCEHRLRTVERALTELTGAEVESRWVADALSRFDEVWEMLTIENQARLVSAVVKSVVVDDMSGTVSAELADLTNNLAAALREVPYTPVCKRNTARIYETETRP